MKRFFSVFCVFIFVALSVCTNSMADTLIIDTDSASDDEINIVLEALQTEKENRIISRLTNMTIQPDADGIIMFRNIPWYATCSQVMNTLGITTRDRSLGNVYRLSYIDYSNTYKGSDYVDGELGFYLYSNDYTVAGYKPSRTYFRFMAPVVDGEIIRDETVTQFYMGYYTFDGDDFGDLNLVYSDLESKLNALYGSGTFYPGEYHTYTIWKDTKGNMIRLQINPKYSNWLTLAYIANDADARIDELAEICVAEKTREEEKLRLENTNNVDGL